MKDLPFRSSASYTKGLWFVHEDEQVIVRVWASTMSGKERIYINNDLVSEKSTGLKFISVHRVEYGKDQYEIELALIDFQRYDVECNIYCNGHLLKSFACAFGDQSGALEIREVEENEKAVVRAIDRFRSAGIKKLEEYEIAASIKELQSALAIDPDDAEVHLYLACGFSLLENIDQGFEHLQTAIESGLKGKDRILTIDQLAFLRIQPRFEAFKKDFL